MTISVERNTVSFEEFSARVERLAETALRQANLLGVRPEPSMIEYQKMTDSERRVAFARSSVHSRKAFEEWFARETAHVKLYHEGEWAEGVIAANLQYYQEYVDDISQLPGYVAGTPQIELDADE